MKISYRKASLLQSVTFGSGVLVAFYGLLTTSMFLIILGLSVLILGGLLLMLGFLVTDEPVVLQKQIAMSLDGVGEPEWDIVLKDAGHQPIAVTRCLRQCYTFGLREASLIVQHTPGIVKSAVSRQEAELVSARLAKCGATVDIAKTMGKDA